MAAPVEHRTNIDSVFSPVGGRGADTSSAVPPQRQPDRTTRRLVRGLSTAGLRISVTYPRRDVVLIALVGELDLSTLTRVQAILDPRLRSTVDKVVLDLSQLTFLAVAGLGLLSRARSRAVAAGTDLRVVVATREVARPLRMTGLDEVLTCYPTVAAAMDCPEG
ncbi:STAS domain-containing protein [Amycolatopsis palatopharyngis]|uniref:STAS domain-containing protein n=1 Tax=Amycolatopsis palatopharyngis TaxID=187982 RepID=UPI0013BEAA2E|nr:STAS domain-containing protein [Amycolatopsis palatopharyngis]